MKEILKRICGLLFCFFIFLPLFAVGLLNRQVVSRQSADVRRNTAPGKPYIHNENREYLAPIEDVHVTDSYVYLYYEAIHTVEVFRADGSFFCTIAFPEERGHRGSELRGRGEEVHLRVNSDLYVFSGDQLQAYYDNADYAGFTSERYLSWDKSVRERTGNAEAAYSLIGGINVYRTAADGTRTTFAARPWWTALGTMWGGSMVALAWMAAHWFLAVPRVAKWMEQRLGQA